MINIIEKEERQEEINSKINEAKEKGLDLYEIIIPDPNGEEYYCICRRPTSQQVAMLQKAKGGSVDKLGRGCLIFPNKEEYDAIINKYPGFSNAIAEQLLTNIGYGAEARAKKL